MIFCFNLRAEVLKQNQSPSLVQTDIVLRPHVYEDPDDGNGDADDGDDDDNNDSDDDGDDNDYGYMRSPGYFPCTLSKVCLSMIQGVSKKRSSDRKKSKL